MVCVCFFLKLIKRKIVSNASRNLILRKFPFKPIDKNLKSWLKLTTKLKGQVGVSYGRQKLISGRCRVSRRYKFVKTTHSRFFSVLPAMIAGFFSTKPLDCYTSVMLQSSGLYFFKNLSNFELFHFQFTNKLFMYPDVEGVLYTLYLGFSKINSYVHFIQDIFASDSFYAKAFGSYALILSRGVEYTFFILELPSGFKKIFFILTPVDFFCIENNLERLKSQKTGFQRKKGRKPKVRGVAMNPVDHPHGGRTKSIRLKKSPWGWNT